MGIGARLESARRAGNQGTFARTHGGKPAAAAGRDPFRHVEFRGSAKRRRRRLHPPEAPAPGGAADRRDRQRIRKVSGRIHRGGAQTGKRGGPRGLRTESVVSEQEGRRDGFRKRSKALGGGDFLGPESLPPAAARET